MGFANGFGDLWGWYRQSSSSREIQRTIEPSNTSVNRVIELNGTPRAWSSFILKHARLIFTYTMSARMSDYLYAPIRNMLPSFHRVPTPPRTPCGVGAVDRVRIRHSIHTRGELERPI